MKRVADKVLADKYTITSFVHSHPRNTVPSGFIHPNRNAGDKVVASLFVKSNGYLIEHYVYNPKYGHLVQYDGSHIIPGVMDFFLVF